MKVTLAHSWGSPVRTMVRFIDAGAGQSAPRLVKTSVERAELARRLKRAGAAKKNSVSPPLAVASITSYRELSEKYAAEIAAGRVLQQKMFGKKEFPSYE